MGPRADDLLLPTDHGLYCPAGDFHVDPWRPVPRAVVTHAHADHARWGCGAYLAATPGAGVLRMRLGEITLQTVDYGEPVWINGVRVSLHPAGHLLGSAQVRVEHGGRVWVVSGDYKTEAERTCTPFEPVRCEVFITESTFGLPVYRWRPESEVYAEINAWWRGNQERGWTSLLLAYSLGKTQRLLSGVDGAIGPILLHGSAVGMTAAYRAAGVALAPAEHASAAALRAGRGRALVIAPPSVLGSSWTKALGEYSVAMASGWMAIRGMRRRRAMDRGFVLSDHADWPGLLEAIAATGAGRVGVTHGHTAPMVRWLSERGIDAWEVPTRYTGEEGAAEADEGAGAAPEAGD
jgi:putative mRNA 3-end processing factor